MAANIQDSCAQILRSVRNSNLNFACQENPYSIYLTIRKSWNKHYSISDSVSETLTSNLEIKLRNVVSENFFLKTELKDYEAKLEEAKGAIVEMETKVEAAEAEAYKLHNNNMKWKVAFDCKDDEIKALKTSIKNSNSDSARNIAELNNLNRILKSKDKEIYKLENCKITHRETIKTLKASASDIKKDQAIVEKQVKSLEKKVSNLKKDNSLSNNNLPSTVSIIPANTSTTPTLSSNNSADKIQTFSTFAIILILYSLGKQARIHHPSGES